MKVRLKYILNYLQTDTRTYFRLQMKFWLHCLIWPWQMIYMIIQHSSRAAVWAEGCRMSGHMASLATPRSASSGTTVWAENYHNYNKNTFLAVSLLSSHIYHPPPICLWHKYCIVVSYFDGISSYVWLPLISANDSRVAGQRRPRQPSFLALVSDLSHQNIGNVWIVRDR